MARHFLPVLISMPNTQKRMITLPYLFCKCFCNSKIFPTRKRQEAKIQGEEEGLYSFA